MDRKDEIVDLLRKNAALLRRDKDAWREQLGISFDELFNCGEALEYSVNGPRGPYFKPSENSLYIRSMRMCEMDFHVRAAEPDSASSEEMDVSTGNGFSVGDLRNITGLGNTAINGYAKKAVVVRAKRGKKNHRYNAEEARAILQAIIDNASEEALRTRCREKLDRGL